MPATSVSVPGFLPTTSGLHFVNYYPHEPTITIQLPQGRTLGLGDAANGLCGGMVFTACDYFEARQQVPADTQPPPPESALYKFIVRRLLDSFNLPLGIVRYLDLMQPVYPDAAPGILPSRANVMLNQEWPVIKRRLDAGHPAPLGFILVKSDEPEDVGKNHQVLAYGYDLDSTDLSLHIYDPNWPNRDDVRLQLSIANAHAPVPLTYFPTESVYCFFHTPYTPVAPPLVSTPAG